MIVGKNSHNRKTPNAKIAMPKPNPRVLREKDVINDKTIPTIIIVTVRIGTTLPSPSIHACTHATKLPVKFVTLDVLNVLPVFCADLKASATLFACEFAAKTEIILKLITPSSIAIKALALITVDFNTLANFFLLSAYFRILHAEPVSTTPDLKGGACKTGLG